MVPLQERNSRVVTALSTRGDSGNRPAEAAILRGGGKQNEIFLRGREGRVREEETEWHTGELLRSQELSVHQLCKAERERIGMWEEPGICFT